MFIGMFTILIRVYNIYPLLYRIFIKLVLGLVMVGGIGEVFRQAGKEGRLNYVK
jgi:hypothetical protein